MESVVRCLCEGAEPTLPSFACKSISNPWLSINWDKDAVDTARIISAIPGKPDWLIADHYSPGCRWEGELWSHVHRIFVIDNQADRMHDGDLLLARNRGLQGWRREV